MYTTMDSESEKSTAANSFKGSMSDTRIPDGQHSTETFATHNNVQSQSQSQLHPQHGHDDARDEKAESSPPASPTAGGHAKGGEFERNSSKATIALVMLALCMAVFLAALDTTIITTALPTIAEHFHSSAGYTWIGSAYLLGAASATPIWGKISDIFGRKPILLIANLVFMAGSLIAALSVNIGMLITARAIQGIGGGGLITLVNICIGDLFSMRTRGMYYGLVGGTWAVASACGPLIGGAFTQEVTWRWCFYINLPLDGIAFLIIFFFLNKLHTPKTPLIAGLKAIDWLGSLTVVGGTLMILFGLQLGGATYPWDSATIICLLVFGAVTIGLFFINEWRIAPYPVIPLHIFSVRSNVGVLGVCFFHGFTFIGGSYYLPLFFQACLGATPILSGVYTLATALSLSFSSMFTGIFIRKTGKYLPPIFFGLALMTLGFGLFIDYTADSSWAKIIIYQIVAGLGVGPLFQAPLIALQSHIARGDIAAATATFQFVRNIGTSVSVVIGAVVFQNRMTAQAPTLISSLGAATAARFAGFEAAANVAAIDALPSAQKAVARAVFANSLHDMWIMYTVSSAVGLAISFLITKMALDEQHETTKTGLAAEEEKRKLRQEARKSRKSQDVEGQLRGSIDGAATSPTKEQARA